VLVTSNQAFAESEPVKAALTPITSRRTVLWTDDFSSLFQVISD
jgi:hypothetical protein